MIDYGDIKWVRDVLKEASEADDIEDVREELKEAQELLEEYLI